jgi:hypothetical protein|tara:strand:- start:766 stop:972 length:207 start_codon:yes stop_codon:yes gene_type:complete
VLTKKKKYFKPNNQGVSTAKLSFLIRWFDDSDCIVKNDGPFSNVEEAEEALLIYLKRGVCSWIVKYDD